MQRRIDVDVERPATVQADVPADDDITHWIQTALDGVGCRPERNLDVAVLLTDAEDIRRINREYRQRDKATNVLSFPGGELSGLPAEAALLLGDIVFCPEVIAREAREQNKRVDWHWCHLCVHGALHLAGYDHIEAAEAERMEGIERRLLAGFGIPDPYSPS